MSAKIILKKNEERRIKSGHLWVFSNEIEKREGEASNGNLVDLFDYKMNFLGEGFYNKNSLISVRLLKMNDGEDLNSFFRNKLQQAYSLRKQFYPERNSFRMVFSESDFLPGLIIDKYNNTYVLQVYSAGMEKNISLIVEYLKKDFNAENIFTKNESYFRNLEGLPEQDEIYFGEIKDEIINDGILNYKISFSTGHKTGFYFDQNDNRIFFRKICGDKNVLDAFCNIGGFGLHAAHSGAKSVTFVDSSSSAINFAIENFKLNKLQCNKEFIIEDVFDYFEKCINEKKYFDIINIDPPAFAKNRKSLPAAIKGYEKLNRLALELINTKSGSGFLSTSSCSHHLNEDEFLRIINRAAVKSKKRIQLVHLNGASLDHPRLLSMPETSYLKYAVFKVYNV